MIFSSISKYIKLYALLLEQMNLMLKSEEVVKIKMDELYTMGNNITQKDKGLLTILELPYEI